MTFKVPEKYRVTKGLPDPKMNSTPMDGNNGVFIVKSIKLKRPIHCIVSQGMGWEHVSASLPTRCPTWEEMCIIKSIFWDDEDSVMQLHPPKSDWVNNHPYCLHLWRPMEIEIPLPPSIMVGYQELNVNENKTK